MPVSSISFCSTLLAPRSPRSRKLAMDAVEVTIPKLNEMAFEQAELAGVPFSAFVANRDADGQTANNSLVLRGYVRSWMNQATSEYDRIGLIDRLSDRGVTTQAA